MVCVHCGKQIVEESSYCNFCGSRQRSSSRSRLLTRSSTNTKIGGVCGGLGEYFGVDATIVRLIWLALSVVPGGIVGGILAYLLAWIVIPASATEEATAELPLKPVAKAS
jgi:phage shock protein C